jgi:hypothetical protein
MGLLLHSNKHLQISTVTDRLSMFVTCGWIPLEAPTRSVLSFLTMHVDALKDKFSFCETLSEATKAVDVFGMVKSSLPKKTSYSLHRWSSSEAW